MNTLGRPQSRSFPGFQAWWPLETTGQWERSLERPRPARQSGKPVLVDRDPPSTQAASPLLLIVAYKYSFMSVRAGLYIHKGLSVHTFHYV